MKGINAFANKRWTLVSWPRLNSLLLANQIEFLDMFWWFDRRIKLHPVFPRIVNQLFEAWVWFNLSAGVSAQKLGREQKRGMKGLSLPNSEFRKGRLNHGLLKFFEYLCTLNTFHTRIIIGQITVGKSSPRWLKIRSKKATRKPKRALSPSFYE